MKGLYYMNIRTNSNRYIRLNLEYLYDYFYTLHGLQFSYMSGPHKQSILRIYPRFALC